LQFKKIQTEKTSTIWKANKDEHKAHVKSIRQPADENKLYTHESLQTMQH